MDKEKITSEAIPKYLSKAEKSDPSARKTNEQHESESVKSVERQHSEVVHNSYLLHYAGSTDRNLPDCYVNCQDICIYMNA